MSVKISALTALTSVATGDLVPFVDISDTTMAATGTDKKVTMSDLLASMTPNVVTTITSTLGTVTTASKPFLSGSATWNDAAVDFEGIVLDVTHTASNSAKLINLKVGGTTVFSVDRSANIAGVQKINAGLGTIYIDYGEADLQAAYNIIWYGGNLGSSSPEVGIRRNAAGVLEINNGSGGTFRDLKCRDITTTGQVTIGGTSASSSAGQVSIGGVTRTTIGANGAASALTANPLGYLDVYIAGTAAQIPYYNRGA